MLIKNKAKIVYDQAIMNHFNHHFDDEFFFVFFF